MYEKLRVEKSQYTINFVKTTLFTCRLRKIDKKKLPGALFITESLINFLLCCQSEFYYILSIKYTVK